MRYISVLFALLAGIFQSAAAQVVIDVPDQPEFTIDTPIETAEDLVINVGPSTRLIIDAPISANNILISSPGELVVTDAALFMALGDVSISFPDASELPDSLELSANVQISASSSATSGAGQVLVSSEGPDAAGGKTTEPGRDAPLPGSESDSIPIVAIPILISDETAVFALTPDPPSAQADAFAVQVEDQTARTIRTSVRPEIAAVGLGAADLSAELGRANRFVEGLFSCPDRRGGALFTGEVACAYARAGAGFFDFDGGADGQVDDRSFDFTAGAQVLLADGWILGSALGYTRSNTDDPSSEAKTDRGRAGAVLKYTDGGFAAGLGLSGAFGSGDIARSTPLGTAQSSVRTSSIATRLQTGYTFGHDAGYVRPMLGAGVTYLRQGDYTEDGAGLAGIAVESADEVTFSLHPAVALGGDWSLGSGEYHIRPSLRLGIDWYDDPGVRVDGTLLDVVPVFDRIALDRVVGRVTAGATLLAGDDISLTARYSGAFGANTIGHGGELRISLAF